MALYDDILDAADNQANHGGTKITLFYTPSRDVQTDSVLKTPVVNPEDAYILATGPVMHEGKKVLSIEIALTSGTLTVENIGENQGTAFKQNPKFQVVGSNLKALPLFNSPNGKFIFWIPLNNGLMYQIGSKDVPAQIRGGYNGGETSGNGSFYEFEIISYAARHLVFTGTLPLEVVEPD